MGLYLHGTGLDLNGPSLEVDVNQRHGELVLHGPGIGFDAHGPSMGLDVHAPVIRFGPAIGFDPRGPGIGLELHGPCLDLHDHTQILTLIYHIEDQNYIGQQQDQIYMDHQWIQTLTYNMAIYQEQDQTFIVRQLTFTDHL